MGRPDGYRYVRAYRVKDAFGRPGAAWHWALYEVRGGKARRVGTAKDELGYRAYLASGVACGR